MRYGRSYIALARADSDPESAHSHRPIGALSGLLHVGELRRGFQQLQLGNHAIGIIAL